MELAMDKRINNEWLARKAKDEDDYPDIGVGPTADLLEKTNPKKRKFFWGKLVIGLTRIFAKRRDHKDL